MAGFTTNDPEGHAARLRDRFRRSSKPLEHADRKVRARRAWNRRVREYGRVIGYFALFLFIVAGNWAGIVAWVSHDRGWNMETAFQHVAAWPNCRAAYAVGLAPALRGEPGYYDRHDADNDGIACEMMHS